MKKVLVIGCPASGKTTFSRKLAEKNNLPIFYLDKLYYQDSWNVDSNVKKNEWRDYIRELVKKDKWLMDGNYTSTLDIRIPASDTVILLDYPRWLVLVRIFKRGIKRHHDDSKNKNGGMSWKLLKFVWQFKSKERPKVLKLIDKYAKDKNIHIFTNPEELEKFLVQ